MLKNQKAPVEVMCEIDNGSTGQLDRIIQRTHHTPEDFIEGDIQQRIDEFKYYHCKSVDITKINKYEFDVSEELVKDYVEKIKNEGVEEMPPILISDTGSVIDGLHRVNALLEAGFSDFPIYVGSHESLKEKNKIEKKSTQRFKP